MRANWTRWSVEDLARLRTLAGRKRAEDIAADLGRTVEQVRGAAARHKIALTLGPYARNWKIIRQSKSMHLAWKDPEKRARMLGQPYEERRER